MGFGKMKSRWATILLLVLFAWMATGGTFTCTTDDHDHHHHHGTITK